MQQSTTFSTQNNSRVSAPLPFPTPNHIHTPQPSKHTHTTFLNEFELVAAIGSGCFGKILRLQHRPSQTAFSLKKVLLDLSYHNRELSTLQAVKGQPHLLQLHSFLLVSTSDLRAFLAAKAAPLSALEQQEAEGLQALSPKYQKVLYLLTKCYSGDLRAHLLKQGVTREQLSLVFRALASGLASLHGKGFCHRDLKPDNVLVDFSGMGKEGSGGSGSGGSKEGELVIGDLGSAKDFSEKAGGIAYICSRPYRAPELLLGREDYGFAIDAWSLGCVLYEVCSAKRDRLFKGKNNKEVLLEIVALLGKPTEEDLLGMNEKRKLDVVSPTSPKSLRALLHPAVEDKFVRVVEGLLRWNPKARLKLESIPQLIE